MRNPLELNSILTCKASECHISTLLMNYPPQSGKHDQHLNGNYHNISCLDCHNTFNRNSIHKNSIINGYNSVSNTQAPGDIVIFDTNFNPDARWDNILSSCSNMDCHENQGEINWYGSGTSYECIDCHGSTGSHAVHVASNIKGSATPLACTVCHEGSNYPLFENSRNLQQTQACDNCHSPNGPYNGVTVTGDSIGAKDNWYTGVYNGNALQDGKEKWCIGCHDNDPGTGQNESAFIDGVYAPGISGNNAYYGFYISGHGKPGIDGGCLSCHSVSFNHIDGDDRSYSAVVSETGYQEGFRLKDINGGIPMEIPLNGGYDANQFALCYSCHNENGIIGDSPITTGFRNLSDQGLGTPPSNNHKDFHLDLAAQMWNSDRYSGNDSRISCPACHDPHSSLDYNGSTTVRMTRQDMGIVHDSDGNGYYGYMESNEWSLGSGDLVCSGCHGFGDGFKYYYQVP